VLPVVLICMPTKKILFIILALIFSRPAAYAQQDPADPFQTAEVQHAPISGFNLIDVSLDLKVDYEKLSFNGTVTNTLIPLHDSLSSIILYCGANLDVA
jgi:hypothetical protein